MSGRVISGWRSGKPIVGFRKTERTVVSRRKADEMPEWRARFIVPDRIGFALAAGRVHSIVGAELSKSDFSTIAAVTGANRAWVLRQADVLANAIGLYARPLYVALQREPWPECATIGSIRRGDEGVVEIGFGGSITEGNAMRSVERGCFT